VAFFLFLDIQQPYFGFSAQCLLSSFGFLKMLKRKLFAVALLMSVASFPAYADDVTDRVDSLEQQVRNLVGQIEELNYTIKQMQTQITGAPQQQGEVAPIAPKPLVLKKKLVLNDTAKAGVETIEETPLQQDATQAPQDGTLYDGGAEQTGTKVLGTLGTGAAKAGDAGFDGQVLVAPEGDQAVVAADGVQQASVEPETPDDLFLRSEKSLLQLQFSEAETGFKEFLSKFPDHNLAGSAQYKLGETYYAQQNYADAAQNYLSGYKQYPKSRRAADSLMKLGLSLNKLGQKEQGCAALGSVGTEFPNSVEAKKRAQAEFKRASC
jgi:tol-pal system protein YbgF